MSKPKNKSISTLVRLGPALDTAVTILGHRNSMSYAACVRLLVMLGCRALIKSGTFQGWVVPEELEEILDQWPLKTQIPASRKEILPRETEREKQENSAQNVV